MKSSHVIFTDSGGIQEEATAINKKVYVLRDSTERPEALDTGLVQVIGTKEEAIKESLDNISPPSLQVLYPFGNGDASKKIIKVLHKNGY